MVAEHSPPAWLAHASSFGLKDSKNPHNLFWRAAAVAYRDLMEEREETKPDEKEKVVPKVIRPQIGLALSAEKAGTCLFILRRGTDEMLPGLENVDKQKVNKIVYEISKDSKYYKNEQKKSARVESSIKVRSQQCVIFAIR